MRDNETIAGGWYEATRVASPERERLNFDLDVDVCVIGAGLAGLTAAREVAQRGWSVAVLEAGRVAWAASGRNTGFVLPGFGEHIDDIVERVGLDHAKQLWGLSERGVDYVRFTIEDTGMAGVEPVPGWLHVSKTDNAAELVAQVERLRWIGADVEVWPTARVREQLANPRYFDAVHFRRAFHIHPLNYALGLAALAEKAGARIFEQTPAVSIDPSGVRKRIVTPNARVRAGHVVLAGNVDLGALMPRLSATLLPVTTFVLVTEPLGPVLHELVRYRGAVSDTNRADNHYRIVGENRL
ncbi:MAG TPA: FAD-binding oxidoreductase, partial [Pseudolabrys sp.]|nr:FAD-binding oxidoreductase [Pseudolabrys sp.]